MGTWGPGPLENDDAQALVIQSRKSSASAKRIAAAFSEVVQNGDDYLEAPSAQTAIAAAEILTTGLIESDRVSGIDLKFAKLACAALERVLTPPSEIVELWQESKDFQIWKSSVEVILDRLKTHAKG